MATATRRPGFNLSGTISNIVLGTDKSGNPYAKAQFDTTIKGQPAVRLAMAFGRAYESVRDALVDGHINFYGRFDGGVFAIIGLTSKKTARTASTAVSEAPVAAPLLTAATTPAIVAFAPTAEPSAPPQNPAEPDAPLPTPRHEPELPAIAAPRPAPQLTIQAKAPILRPGLPARSPDDTLPPDETILFGPRRTA